MTSGGASLQPTFNGHVSTTQDALALFEACLQGHLSHVPRRPHDRERSSLIRSGSVFIYEENASGIKRWTDGVLWSPSRILGNFLVYRELDKPFPPGQKKKAFQKNKRRPSRPGEPYPRPEGGNHESYSPTTPQSAAFCGEKAVPEEERMLIGSLVDSYEFKVDGLVKKTMSVTVQGVTHHLVSYYNISDVLAGNLRTPSSTDTLQYIRPRLELTTKQSFRAPIEEGDDIDPARAGQQSAYGYRMGAPGYMPSHYYIQSPYAHMPQPPTTAAYPMTIPPMAPPYLQTHLPNSQLPPRPNEYSPYHQNSYNRSYEALATPQSATIPNTPNSAIPPMGDRSQPQPSSLYQQSSLPQRQMSNMSPVSMDARNAAHYGRGSYSMASEPSAIDGQRQPDAPPTHMKYEDRREPQPVQAPMYPGQRPQYYPETSNQSAHPGHYQQPHSLPHWTNATQTP